MKESLYQCVCVQCWHAHARKIHREGEAGVHIFFHTMYDRVRKTLSGNHLGQWNLRSHLRMFNKTTLGYFRRMFSFLLFCFTYSNQPFLNHIFPSRKGLLQFLQGLKSSTIFCYFHIFLF